MSARIIAQIDALIARLAAARELLASTVVEAEPGRVVAMEAREPATSAEIAPAAPVQVTVLKPRGPRARRTFTRRRSAAPVAAALAGQIPQRPVAVSPQQLAVARESRAVEQAKGQASQATAAPRSALDELVMEVAKRSA